MGKPRITKLYELAAGILCLFEGTETRNPYDVMVEQIDWSSYFYRTHKEDVYRLYHLLVHGFTCLHQLYRMKDKSGRYESTREDNILALHLLQEEGFAHSYLPHSAWATYHALMSYYGTGNTFTRQQANVILQLNVHTAKWHLKKLREHGYLVRTGGDQFRGFTYRLIDKLNPFQLAHTLKPPEDARESTAFEVMQPEVNVKWPL